MTGSAREWRGTPRMFIVSVFLAVEVNIDIVII
jgi:hypothetical protein